MLEVMLLLLLESQLSWWQPWRGVGRLVGALTEHLCRLDGKGGDTVLLNELVPVDYLLLPNQTFHLVAFQQVKQPIVVALFSSLAVDHVFGLELSDALVELGLQFEAHPFDVVEPKGFWVQRLLFSLKELSLGWLVVRGPMR